MKTLVLQPALPHYRRDFFDRVHAALGEGFSVSYSPTQLSGITASENEEPWARRIGPVRPLAPGMEWQDGALSLSVGRGDVLVICGAPRTISTLALIAKARLAGAKVIWWGHYWSSTSKAWRFKLRMQMLRACDGVLFYTEAEVKEYLAGEYTSGAVLGALNNGINTDPIAAHRQAYDPASRENAALFIGRLTEKANLSALLDALARIAPAKRPRLEVIGTGEEEAALKQQASALGLAESVVWHGAITDEARIAPIANRCRLFVYPGEVGLSLIHAMAYGLPAIVHDNRWRHMPEIAAFEDGVTGRAFVHGDTNSLAQTLGALALDEGALAACSKASLAKVEDTFNTRDMARRFVDFVERIAQGRASGHAAGSEA